MTKQISQQSYKIGGIEIIVTDRVVDLHKREWRRKDFSIITPKSSASFSLEAKRGMVLEEAIRAAHRGG